MGCVTPKRKLKKVNVSHISLVDKGANFKNIIWKSESESNIETYIEIQKSDEEQQMVYGIVYSPDEVDSQGDYTDIEVIKQMSYDFMKNKNVENIDVDHTFKNEDAFVAESWLIKSPDSLFPNEKEGSWAVGIKVNNPEIWNKIKNKEINGLSMAGIAETEEINKVKKKETIMDKILKLFGIVKEDTESTYSEEQYNELSTILESLNNSISSILNLSLEFEPKKALLDEILSIVNDKIPTIEEPIVEDAVEDPIIEKIETPTEESTEESIEVQTTDKPESNEVELYANIERFILDAVTPLNDKIKELEASIADKITKIESLSKGSKQSIGKEIDKSNIDNIWLGI